MLYYYACILPEKPYFYTMNADNLSDLPEWDDDRLNFGIEEDEGEGWKPNPTREACKALYRQWREVMFVLKGILNPILEMDEKEDEMMLVDCARMILTDAHIVGAKIMSSEAGGIYIIRMENAAIIRQLAQSVATSLLLFVEEDTIDNQYIEVVRNEVQKFRLLFIKWVKTFEKDEFTDEWGLFV